MEFRHHFPCFTRSLKSARKEVSNIRQIGRENSNKKSTIPTSQKASDIAILIAPKINQPVKKKSKGILVKKLNPVYRQINKFLQRITGPNEFTGGFSQTFKKEINILYQNFQKI